MDISCLPGFSFPLRKIFCNGIIQEFLIKSEIVTCGLRMAFFVQRIAIPILHVFLQPAYKEFVGSIHSKFSDSLSRKVSSGKNVFIKQLQKSFESVLTSSVRGSRQKQQMLTLLRENVSYFISL